MDISLQDAEYWPDLYCITALLATHIRTEMTSAFEYKTPRNELYILESVENRMNWSKVRAMAGNGLV